jgi:hypothetical protein
MLQPWKRMTNYNEEYMKDNIIHHNECTCNICEPFFKNHMEAFELGWKAGLKGLDPRLCPFPKMTLEWKEWQSFHEKATKLIWQ